MMMKTLLLSGLTMLALGLQGVAEEKNGLRVNVTKSTLSRNDGPSDYFKEVSRDMTLKVTVKNISMKDFPAAEVKYTILLKRWGNLETGEVESTQGTLTLPALRAAQEVTVPVGDFHIGGHMHGNSDRHVDQLAGWQMIIKHGEKETEFASGTNFASLNARAKAAAGKKGAK